MQHFYFLCLPGLSLLRWCLAHFCWPRRMSSHLSPRSVAAGVGPLPLAQHFYSFVSQISRSVTAGVRPFPLAMQHFYSFVSQISRSVTGGVRLFFYWPFICLPGLCWCPPFSAGRVAFLFPPQTVYFEF